MHTHTHTHTHTYIHTHTAVEVKGTLMCHGEPRDSEVIYWKVVRTSFSSYGFYTPETFFIQLILKIIAFLRCNVQVPGDRTYESPITPHHGEHHDRYISFEYDNGTYIDSSTYDYVHVCAYVYLNRIWSQNALLFFYFNVPLLLCCYY